MLSFLKEVVAVAGVVLAVAVGVVAGGCGDRTGLDVSGTPSGLSSAGGTSCSAGAGTFTLASGLESPSSLVVDSDGAFWISGNNVMKVSLCGGLPVTLASQQTPGGLAVDATSVYWPSSVQDSGIYTSLVRVDKEGGATVTIATFDDIVGFPGANEPIAVRDGNVYWAGNATCHSVLDGGDCGGMAIISVPLTGGSTTTLASQQPGVGSLAVDATSVYWANWYDDVNNPYDGALLSVPLAGGESTTLASMQGDPDIIVVNGQNVYWWDDLGGNACFVPIQGGGVTTLLTSQLSLSAMAVDAGNVYWATPAPAGSIQKVAIDRAGMSVTLIDTGGNYTDIAVDGTSLYWIDGSSVVRRTPK